MKSACLVLVAVPFLANGAPRAEEVRPIPNWTAPPSFALSAQALPSSPLPFTAIAPCRIVDTRGGAPLGGGVGPFSSGSTRDFDLNSAGPPCTGIPANAGAYSVNVTVTNDSGRGFLAIYPTGNPPNPMVSLLNYDRNTAVANATVVPCDANGSVTVLNQGASTDVVIDINGYYAPISRVSTVDGLSGDVVLSPGASMSIVPGGNTLTIGTSAGTITGVTAGNGVTGGGTSGNVTMGFAVPLSLTGSVPNNVLYGGNTIRNGVIGYGPGLQGFSVGGTGVLGLAGVNGTNYGVRGDSQPGQLGTYGLEGSGQIGVAGVSGAASANFGYSYVGKAGVWGTGSTSVGVFGTSTTNEGVAGVSVYYHGVFGASVSGLGVFCNGTGRYTGNWTSLSDGRVKRSVRTLSQALERVASLRGVSFCWRGEEHPGQNLGADRQVGFLAQEVEPIVPECVTTVDGWKAVDYAKLTPLLVEALKTQQARIEALRAEIDALKKASVPMEELP